jgi:Uma2 family endonuclease
MLYSESMMSTTTHISYDQYNLILESGAFDGEHRRRVELIHEEIRDMTPIGPLHEDAVDFLTRWSFANLNSAKVRVRVQNSIGLSELDSVPEPDIAWVAEKSYREQRPQAADVLLVIEVADSSLDVDMNEKSRLYAAAGVSDYWVIDLQNRRIEVFQQPSVEGYAAHKTYSAGESIRPLNVGDIELLTSDLLHE